MPTDYEREYGRYEERFDRLVGPLREGQYGHHRGRLVRRFDPAQFQAKVDEYMQLGARFSQMLNAGDTIDDTLAIELRALEVELVLERSLFLPSPS